MRHLQWVPHFLSLCQKLYRVSVSQQLFLMLERQEWRSWHNFATLDESWFYLHIEPIWARPDGETPEREPHIVQSQKVMLTIVWNPGGFHLVNILPNGFKFNASHSVTQILDPLSKWRRTQVGRTNRKLIVHPDNTRPHTAKMTSCLWSRIQCRGHHIQHTQPIWHPVISTSLAM
jgi:hypothetical protein